MAETLDVGAEGVDSGTLETGSKMEMEMESSQLSDSVTKMGPGLGEGGPVSEGTGQVKEKESSFRADIDTSAPFESVKEAANRFGGIGFWRPNHHKHSEAERASEEVDIAKVEEQATQLEKDLFAKERETLDVLKQLETTKTIVEELKLKLQKEASELSMVLDTNSSTHSMEEAKREDHGNFENGRQNLVGGLSFCPSAAPGLILMELKQAKLNLTRTTNDLSDIRASVVSYNQKLEEERISLEKTRTRLTSNSSKILSLEGELNETKKKLQQAEDTEIVGRSDNPVDVSRELQVLNSEAEQFKRKGVEAKSQVMRAISEIEQTKTRIKTAEIRLVAAKKMKEAARAAEAVALAEIRALSKRESSSGVPMEMADGITLSYEEYSSLTAKAREAEELSKKRVTDAMLKVDDANVSKMDILKRVEEATEEVKASKMVLEEALDRVETANRGKLAVEEALRKWRSDHARKRRSANNSAKFKKSYPSHHRSNSRLIDVNGLNLTHDVSGPVLRPTLSIGQILSRKLLQPEGYEPDNQAEISPFKQKVSLGQMLSKQIGEVPISRKADKGSGDKHFSIKRKKFGFARFSLLLTKQSKKKKKTSNF